MKLDNGVVLLCLFYCFGFFCQSKSKVTEVGWLQGGMECFSQFVQAGDFQLH